MSYVIHADTEINGLLEHIQAQHGLALRLERRFTAGENHGAYAVTSSRGQQYALKVIPADPTAIRRLDRAAIITTHLRDLGVPVPRFVLSGTLPSGDLYELQQRLPGSPVGRLTTVAQAQRIIDLNERQAGQATFLELDGEQNWSAYAADAVFRGGSGWAEELRAYGPDTAAVMDGLVALTDGKEDACQRSSDIVHGDLSPTNILVTGDPLPGDPFSGGGDVCGIVDWDAAGCGDLAFDLAVLLFYHYDNLPIRTILQERVLAVSGHDALCVYLAYTVMSQTTWSIRHHGRSAVDHWLSRAGRILHDLGRQA